MQEVIHETHTNESNKIQSNPCFYLGIQYWNYNNKGDRLSWKTKLDKWVLKKKREIQNKREYLAERDSKRQRRKLKKIQQSKPSAVRTIREGLATRSSPLRVMKQEYNRRKYEREKKYNRKSNDSTKENR